MLPLKFNFKLATAFLFFHRFANFFPIFFFLNFLLTFNFSLSNFISLQLLHSFLGFNLLFLEFQFSLLLHPFILLGNLNHLLRFQLCLLLSFKSLLFSTQFKLRQFLCSNAFLSLKLHSRLP
jgi:hypothetical protein